MINNLLILKNHIVVHYLYRYHVQNFILNYFIFVDKEEKYDSMLTMLTNSSIAMRNKLIKLLKDISEYKPQEKMLSCHQGYEAILLIISNEEGLCASQISKKINISRARLSKIVNRLKKDNLILFFQDEKNNRINRIYLKEKENPFSQDGVHPKGFYYSLWAKNMAEYLKNH